MCETVVNIVVQLFMCLHVVYLASKNVLYVLCVCVCVYVQRQEAEAKVKTNLASRCSCWSFFTFSG